jgi:hypothetical protein
VQSSVKEPIENQQEQGKEQLVLALKRAVLIKVERWGKVGEMCKRGSRQSVGG